MPRIVRSTNLRDHLSEVLKELISNEKYFIVTKQGKPISALVNLEFFEDLLAATSPEYLSSIQEARDNYRSGKTFSHEDVFGEL